jgi:iron complex transport system substrate-binding protein
MLWLRSKAARFLLGRFLLVLLSLCGLAGTGWAAPARVVSVNLCTDQMAMMIAAPGQLRAISILARDKRSSAMAAAAELYPVTSGQAEDVFRLGPDLVLAGTYTTAVTVQMLTRLGVRVELFEPATSFAAIAANLRRMGQVLGREAVAEQLAVEMETAVAALSSGPSAGPAVRAVFLDANSYTAGPGNLVHVMLQTAGLENIAASRGLLGTARLPLEVLLLAKPDILITAGRFDAPSVGEAVLDHPALAELRQRTGAAVIAGQSYACGLPQALAAVQGLVAAREAVQNRRLSARD